MNKDVLFSSKYREWETPQELFDLLDAEFGFTVDVAATLGNAKCPVYYDATIDGLSQDWTGETVWCNPPYDRGTIRWVKKAAEMPSGIQVLLMAARTDTRWFHDYVYDENTDSFRQGVEVRFIRGRLKFSDSKDAAPFPSMIVIFKHE